MDAFKRAYLLFYTKRHPLVMAFYGGLAGASYLLAYLLRFEFHVPPSPSHTFRVSVGIVIVVRMAFAWLFRLSNGRWRFVSTSDVLRLVAATTCGTILLFALRWMFLGELLVPRSVLLIEWVLTTYGTGAVWIGYRVLYERMRRLRWSDGSAGRSALIIGAGEAGNLLAREILRFPVGYRLVGFLDDDPMKWGSSLQGVVVLGGTERLAELVEDCAVEEVILAIPSASPDQLRRLVKKCEQTDVSLKVLPGIAQVLSGNVQLRQLRTLQIEDLLGREPVELKLPELAADLDGCCVLITGAAGSIGSELARQVALNRPRRLVLFDQAETPLFYLELEMRERCPELDLAVVMGDIVDEHAVDAVFDTYAPDRVFHAAAYKHVPMLETNPLEAVRNNVVGTRRVADAAGRHRAGKFVLVSTDKAVRPSSVMGATKRLAELVVLGMQERYPTTAYGAVRFGNVLGSNGSVLPLFRRQLERSQPLGVTHPDVTRYFMTIPEAVQLILKASLVPEFRGHIAMLDMGEPVRILELAKNLLRLSGVPPRIGQSIVFTGLRPGEKLHEELSAPEEQTVATRIEKVRLLRSCAEPDWQVLDLVERWEALVDQGDDSAILGELGQLFRGLEASGSLASSLVALVPMNGNGRHP